jgi:hypothetical protein
MSDPLKTKFPLSTEAQLYAAPLVALGTGEVLNQTGNAETMYPELFGPGKRARQAAVDAAMERQRIDDMDERGIAASRPIPSDLVGSADFNVPAMSPDRAEAWKNIYAQNAATGASYPAGGTTRYTDVPVGELDPKYAATAAAVAAAKQPRGGKELPQPTRRPAEFQGQNSGFLSNLFANRPVSTADLYKQSQANPDDSGAYMRAERQYAATHKDKPNFDLTKLDEKGMARGGAANASPTKEALLHKSLEIIHHMIRSR